MNKKILFLILILFHLSVFTEELELWCSWIGKEKDVLVSVIAKYELLTGEKIKVKFIPFGALNGRFKGATIAGKGPDLVIGPSDWIGQFIPEGLLEDVNKFFSEKEKSKYIESVLNSCYYNDKLYGLPESYKLMSLYYNKDIIKEAPKTTKELIDLALKFTNVEEGKYGLAYKTESYYRNVPWVTGFGAEILDKNNNPKFNTLAQEKAIKFVEDLLYKYKVVPEKLDIDTVIELFKEGICPMIIDGSWIYSSLEDSKINFGIDVLPMVSETSLWASPFVAGEIIMMSSKTKNQDLAFKFMEFLCNSDNQLEFALIGHLPSKKEVYDYKKLKDSKVYKYIKAFEKQSKYAIPMPSAPELAIGIWTNGSNTLKKVFSKEETIKEALKEAQEKSIKDIEEFRKKYKY